MLDRVILSTLLQYYRMMALIDPNTGNEMGKQEGDSVNSLGNHHISATSRRINTTVAVLLQLLSMYVSFYVPLGYFDWFLFGLATMGLAICYWAYFTLDKYYTFTIGIRKDHKVVSNGPYWYIRHPGYLGQGLIMIPSILFFRVNIFLTLGLLGFMLNMYWKRVSAEEEMLYKQFGDEYKQFASTRYRLIPYII